MEDFVKRIADERIELQDRMVKLSNFTVSQFFLALDTERKCLLTEQLGHMQKYFIVLDKRLRLELDQDIST